ncbi:hypothetical protein SAY87_017170 [Trapa incisa]|uniref:Uncharacterized protein n=1 Tax=Trapa incisa TaxID=236973 RepID=A0AAN7LBE8_9MYRT|nr:hypothetical protein SAY87_017170 [Trapa incisa]
MACLDLYNKDRSPNNGGGGGVATTHFSAPMGPRISFSNDFVESVPSASKPVIELTKMSDTSSDFEFSVTTYSMMSADELFLKGHLLPFKDPCRHGKSLSKTQTSLREELLMAGEDCDGCGKSLRPSMATGWKGLLGFRKAHVGPKKVVDAKMNISTPDTRAHRSPAPASQVDTFDVPM